MENNYYSDLLTSFKNHTIDNTDITDVRFDDEICGFYDIHNKCEQLDQLFEIEKLNEDLEKHIGSYKNQLDTYIQAYMYEGNKVYDLLLEINRTYKLLILNHMEREQEIFSDEMRKITKINTDYIDLDNKKINILIVRDFNYQQELDDIVRKQLELSKERNNIMIGARKRNNDNKMIRFYEDEKITPLIEEFNTIRKNLIIDFDTKFNAIRNDILSKIFKLDKDYKTKSDELFIEQMKREKRTKIQSNYKKSY